MGGMDTSCSLPTVGGENVKGGNQKRTFVDVVMYGGWV